MKHLILMIMIFPLSLVHAEVKCVIKKVERCNCPAKIKVECPRGVFGYVENEQELTSLKVSFLADGKKESQVLENPDDGVAYLNQSKITSKLMRKTRKRIEKTKLEYLEFDSTALLYKGPGYFNGAMEEVKSRVDGKKVKDPVKEYRHFCHWLEGSKKDDLEFRLDINGNRVNVCTGDIYCNFSSDHQRPHVTKDDKEFPVGFFEIACQADKVTNKCPEDALKCYRDQSFGYKEPFKFSTPSLLGKPATKE